MRRESYNFGRVQVGAVGIGNVGSTALDCLISASNQPIHFISIDSDFHTLAGSKAPLQIPVGDDFSQGLDGGVESATAVSDEIRQEIKRALVGLKILYVMAGLGGVTGSSVTPLVANIARELGIFTIVVVTRPGREMDSESPKIAKAAIKKLEACVDNLIILPTNHLGLRSSEQTNSNQPSQSFAQILCQSMQVITEFVNHNGLINVDLANLKSIMSNRGGSLTTVGVGQGKDRAQLAAQRALFCPELGLSIHGAQGILINIRAGSNLNLVETQTISNIIKSSTYLDAEYVLGVIIDESMVDEIRVSVLATGFSFENWEMEVKHVQPVQHKKPIVARQISTANSGSAASVVPIKKRIQDLSNLPIFAYLRSRLD